MKPSKIELDTVLILWLKSPEQQSFDLSSFEDNALKNTEDKWKC